MLIELHAENIAILDDVEVAFGPGFTAITGETGAGKTLLIDAISLCLGERADTTLVRTGASSATVRAVFDPPPVARACLVELGYDIGDEALYLQRDLAAEGKNTCRVNGKPAPLSALKQIGDTLADLHGQHEHQSLLHPASHVGMLDAWIGDEATSLRDQVSAAWDDLADVRLEQETLERDTSERARMLDVLRFQVDEIRNAEVRVGEIDEIKVNLKRLEGSEQLAERLLSAQEALFAGETAARDLIGKATHDLEAAAAIDPEVAPVLAQLRNAEIAIEEAISVLKARAAEAEHDPERIELLAARLDAYADLRRKYGETEADILAFFDAASRDLDRLENLEAAATDVQARLAAAQSAFEAAAQQLSDCRRKHADKFCGAVASELSDLGMAAARFAGLFETKAAGRDGAERFEFLFSANAGEDPRPLSKIASGGEMSRLMLAVKTVLAGKGGVPTLIFDEIDAGLGGQTAAVVAKKLTRLGENYQVIAITHVPQIAGRATAQISIDKQSVGGRTVTTVRPLSPDDRVHEIARMVGGETVGDAALANARQLLGIQ